MCEEKCINVIGIPLAEGEKSYNLIGWKIVDRIMRLSADNFIKIKL